MFGVKRAFPICPWMGPIFACGDFDYRLVGLTSKGLLESGRYSPRQCGLIRQANEIPVSRKGESLRSGAVSHYQLVTVMFPFLPGCLLPKLSETLHQMR